MDADERREALEDAGLDQDEFRRNEQMSKKEGYSNYDTNGHKTGESRPGIFGGMNHYDNYGHKTGSTRPGILSGANHYDDKGHKTGHSNPGILGGWNHYDD